MGIYVKECSHQIVKPKNCELAPITKAILNQVGLNQIMVTQSVRHLLSGVDLNFSKHSSIIDPKSGSLCDLYQVTKTVHKNTEHASENNSFAHFDPFLENVLNTIDHNIDDETFGVETLSKEVGMSERQLQRKIKTITDKSPNQLIISRRLRKAKETMMLQKYTIAEIAFQSGFSSPSYFSKCFKKEFGIQPTSMIQG
ncbi:MAG: helix-turn-helix transcriptional regulator [Bacteroidales bacterium]|nr:helix-turn-helix transcriptional regulator [Bacteroidales bacterium]